MTDFNPDDLSAADDLLQMMYWLRGILTLRRRGLLERVVIEEDTQYRLTEEGVREGGRRFADEFADLTKPGHGECGDPDCDCQRTGSPEDCRHRVAGLE